MKSQISKLDKFDIWLAILCFLIPIILFGLGCMIERHIQRSPENLYHITNGVCV